MIGLAVDFLIFAVVIVILFLTAKWLMAKLGWAPDPALTTIIGLIVFLLCLIVFLNAVGAINVGTWGPVLRH